MDSVPWYAKPEWWAIIFATLMSLAAITQLYWSAPVKALFLPKKVLIYSALLPDVNFGPAGSCIGMCGSVISKNASSLAIGLRVRAKRVSDGGECTFEALLNRKRSVTMSGDSIDAGIWTVAQLPQDEPTAYDVTFCNDGARSAIKTRAEAIRAGWLQRMSQQIPPPLVGNIPGNVGRVAEANQAIFNNVQNAPFIEDATSQLLEYFFWREGSYAIALEIEVEGQKRIFDQRWQMTITQEMESQLRSNARRMVASACLQPPAVVGEFFTAWPPYEAPS